MTWTDFFRKYLVDNKNRKSQSRIGYGKDIPKARARNALQFAIAAKHEQARGGKRRL
jgi:hypothetical protein